MTSCKEMNSYQIARKSQGFEHVTFLAIFLYYKQRKMVFFIFYQTVR